MTPITRRALVAGLASAPLLWILPRDAAAITTASAQSLVDKVVAEINQIIASGGSDAAIVRQFGQIFDRYADESYIAAYAMGPDARRATPAQRAAFSDAFGSYVTAKYGRRFREFAGGRVTVQSAKQVKTWIEVYATVNLPGSAPFAVTFFVSDRTGRDLFFNLSIEGVSLLLSEREEVGALLDRNRGDIDAMIRALRAMS